MSVDFFRFPHTPHILWLGAGQPREDKVLTDHQVNTLLSGTVSVEEKIDGANLGISLDFENQLCFQNRGQYLYKPFSGQFSRLTGWVARHQYLLSKYLTPNIILFGEWCAARHSLDYGKLPDWFLLFDIYDRVECKFWSVTRRNEFAEMLGIETVPTLSCGNKTIEQLQNQLLVSCSQFRTGSLEGLVIRQDQGQWCEGRAKLVRPDFTQSIEKHWSKRPIEWNAMS